MSDLDFGVRITVFKIQDKKSMSEFRLYEVSVPQIFVRPGYKSSIENFIDVNNDKTDIIVRKPSRHGNTFSPIEQSGKYIKRIIDHDVRTIDVEQSLVAEEVERYNERTKTNIKFGAVTVITDKPVDVISGVETFHDLDRLNLERKQITRQKAVEIAMGSIIRIESSRKLLACEYLF